VKAARFARSEWALLGALALWSVTSLAVLLAEGKLGGGGAVWTGVDGLSSADQLAYFAWMREHRDHLLALNLFDVDQERRVFLHPLFLVSGALWKLGIPVQAVYLAWKPAAVVALAAGVAAYLRTAVGPGRDRMLAVALSLFYFSPAMPLLLWLGIRERENLPGELEFIGHGLAPATQLWGYLPIPIVVGLLAFLFVALERILEPATRAPDRTLRWYAGWASAAGLALAWLHPWQGITALAVIGGLAVWDRLDRRHLALAGPALALAAPVAYFAALSRLDPSWEAAGAQGSVGIPGPHFILAGLGPLLVLALPVLRTLDLRRVGDRVLALWPAAALLLFLAPDLPWRYHALIGASVPLAALAVRGGRLLRAPAWLAIAAVLVLTLPGLAWEVDNFRATVRGDQQLYVLGDGEADALRYLERRDRPGSVLAPHAIGQAVPAFTGRQTYVGHPNGTPDWHARRPRVDALFAAALPPAEALALVRDSGSRFLLSDCRGRADLAPLLGARLAAVRRFGYATVYELR
jgi:hypothetical protein